MTQESIDFDEECDDFWDWFSTNAESLAAMIDNGDTSGLISSIGARLLRLSPQLGWEVGPGLSSEYGFSITLRGTLSNVTLARRVIDRSPIIPRWECRVGRPPKQWKLTFRMRNERGQVADIDASNWQFHMSPVDGSDQSSIVLVAPYLPLLDNNARAKAGSIVVQGILGELEALLYVHSVTLITLEEASHAIQLQPISSLSSALCRRRPSAN